MSRKSQPINWANQLVLGPITYSTEIIRLSKNDAITKYTFVCMVPYTIDFTYKIKTIVRKYLTSHINKYKICAADTLFHVSATTNFIFFYSENVEYILDMINTVKNILNCSRCIGRTLPHKYMQILNKINHLNLSGL